MVPTNAFAKRLAYAAEVLSAAEFKPQPHMFYAGKIGRAWAPANLALIKYWGKRDDTLNLPVTSSLSISLGTQGTWTRIEQRCGETSAGGRKQKDVYWLNGQQVPSKSDFAVRLKEFLDLFRPHSEVCYRIHSLTNLPVAAGLASSASGFAALSLALNELYQWKLSLRELSLLARLGSGSACRSLWKGFVKWNCGNATSGILNTNRISKLAQIDPSSLGIALRNPASRPLGRAEARPNLFEQICPRGGASYATGVYRDVADLREQRSQQSETNLLGANLNREHSDPGFAQRSAQQGLRSIKPKCEGYMDSFAEPLPYNWQDLCVGTLIIFPHPKDISSRQAMQQTVATSPFYDAWPSVVEHDLGVLEKALAAKDFALFGETAESNALSMHATMQGARPSILYSKPQTIAAMQRVWELRRAGIQVFFTQDAGPNLHLLFLEKDIPIVSKSFPKMHIVKPFAQTEEQVVVVDNDDCEIGVAEKIAAHRAGKLHRAFSVFVLREHAGKLEVLLQQRSKNKYHSANLWSNTCCGHPRPNEDLVAAAQRRLQEEMGIVEIDLKEINIFHYRAEFTPSGLGLIENEIDHVLIGYLQNGSEQQIQPNNDEVQAHRWMTIESLQHDLDSNPQKYTIWLRQALLALLQCLAKRKS